MDYRDRNRVNINSKSYRVINDSELKETVHPCDACEVPNEDGCDGLVFCKDRKVHFIIDGNMNLYKEDSYIYEKLSIKK